MIKEEEIEMIIKRLSLKEKVNAIQDQEIERINLQRAVIIVLNVIKVRSIKIIILSKNIDKS